MVSYYYYIIWILSWFIGWGALYHIPENKRNYTRNFITISIYFSIVSFIVIYLFKDIIYPLAGRISYIPLFILAFFFLINFLTYFFSNKFLKKPIHILEKYSDISYLDLDYRYLVSKSFEIFFQQILIVALVFLLNEQGINLYWITLIFAILFGFGHLPMIRLQKGFFGFLVFVASIAASFFFPFLILTFEWGFIYTYILHWLFYINSGVLFWIVQSRYFEDSIDKIKSEEKKILLKED
jgi:hypothetical protein